MKSLKDKSAVVIGATSGVGLATVKRLVSEGASVVAVARGRDGLDARRCRVRWRRANGPGRCDGCVEGPAVTARLQAATRCARRRRPAADGNARRVQLGDIFDSVERRYASCVSPTEGCADASARAGQYGRDCFERSRGRRFPAVGRLRRRKAHAMVYGRVRARGVGREEVRHPLFRGATTSANRRHGDRKRLQPPITARCKGYRRRSFSSVAGRCRSTPIKSVRQSSAPCEEISPTASPQSG